MLLIAGSAAVLLIAAFAVVSLPLMRVGTVFDAGPQAPSDAAMIAHWRKHKDTLDEITEMLRFDPALNRLGMDWSEPEDAARAQVDPARLARYRELMKQASIVSFGRGHRSIHFLYHAGGTVRGAGKGFVRGEASRYAEIVDTDLDEAVGGRKRVLLQRRIDDGWWLQLDNN